MGGGNSDSVGVNCEGGILVIVLPLSSMVVDVVVDTAVGRCFNIYLIDIVYKKVLPVNMRRGNVCGVSKL